MLARLLVILKLSMYDICIYKYTYVKYNINAFNTSRSSRLAVLVPRAIQFFPPLLFIERVYLCRAQTFPFESLPLSLLFALHIFENLRGNSRHHTHIHTHAFLHARMHTRIPASPVFFYRLTPVFSVRIVAFKKRRNVIPRILPWKA